MKRFYVCRLTAQMVEITVLPKAPLPKWSTKELTAQPGNYRRGGKGRSKGDGWAKTKPATDNTPEHLRKAFAEQNRQDKKLIEGGIFRCVRKERRCRICSKLTTHTDSIDPPERNRVRTQGGQ